MTADEAAVAVIDALDRAAIPFMIVGSLASNFHGIPRATRDADFVIRLGGAPIANLAGALPPGLCLEPQAAFETVTGTTRYLVTLRHSPFVCELFVCGDDPHDTARFDRRERVHVLNRVAFMATAEDMIITKLRWTAEARRAKDRDDVRNIIAVRGAELDWNYVDGLVHDTWHPRSAGRGSHVAAAGLNRRGCQTNGRNRSSASRPRRSGAHGRQPNAYLPSGSANT